MLPPALPQGISLFFPLSLSLFISLKWKNEMKFSQIVDRSSEIANCSASAPVQWCSLLPLAVRPSLKVFLSNSLSVSLSLSHWMKKWNEIYELSLYSLIAYLILVSLSLFWTVRLLLVGICFFPVFVFLNLALSYPFLLVSVLVLVKYWLSFSVTCVVICDWHCEIFWLQLAIVIGAHVVLVCCLLSGVGRG